MLLLLFEDKCYIVCELNVAHSLAHFNQRSPRLWHDALTIQPLLKDTPAGTVGSPVWISLQIADSRGWKFQKVRKLFPFCLDLLDDLNLDLFSLIF